MDSILDLCLSCGSHVPDGSAYCSTQCHALDRSQSQNAFLSSATTRSPQCAASSSGSRSRHQPASSSVAGSWPLTYELGPRSAPQQRVHSPIHKYSGRDRQGISIWAQGVYGGGQYVGDSEPSSSTSASFFNDSSDEESVRSSRKSSKRTSSKRSSLPVSHSAPKFPLTAAHLAPPTVISIHTLPHPSHTSIATTTTADDDCSLMTPQSSPSSSVSLVNKVRSWTMSPKNMDTTPTRPTRIEESAADDSNPWISSPPYDFSLGKHAPSPMAAPQRGRALVRPEW